jgi:hypothetical protein
MADTRRERQLGGRGSSVVLASDVANAAGTAGFSGFENGDILQSGPG